MNKPVLKHSIRRDAFRRILRNFYIGLWESPIATFQRSTNKQSSVAMMFLLSSHYFIAHLCVLSNFVLITQQKCGIFLNNQSRSCDSLDDLKTISNVAHVRLELNQNDVNLLNIDGINSQYLVNIVTLEIKNSINNLNRDVFKQFINVQLLKLINNQIAHIPENIFNHGNVEKLHLGYNKIATISSNAFIHLPHLQQLRLDHNRLEKIEYGVFNDLPLKILGLSHNRIKAIALRAFANLPNLTKLYLDGNNLKDFSPQDLFTFGHKLEILWLHTNYFTELTPKMLASLENLHVLNVAFNLITTIANHTFVLTPKLTTLSLTNNYLTTIDSNIFPDSGANHLTYLYLANNRLMFLTTNVLLKLHQLKAVTIGGNPWQCSCLDLILIWLIDNNIKHKCDLDYFDGKRPVCVVSEHYSNKCRYSYDQQYSQHYNNTHRLYPPVKFCLL